MVSVTQKYQITIPKEVREDLHIHKGDKVVFVKNKEEKWILMTITNLTEEMLKDPDDLLETIERTRKGFHKGFMNNIKSLED